MRKKYRTILKEKNEKVVFELLNNYELIEERLNEFNIDITFDLKLDRISLYHPFADGDYYLNSDQYRIYSTNVVQRFSLSNWKRANGFEGFFHKFCEAIMIETKKKEIVYIDGINNEIKFQAPIFKELNVEMMRFLAKNPKYLYDVSSRKFEEIIERILIDYGFETHLTPSTRDGGKDILAWFKNDITKFLTHVECKRYAPNNPVGVAVVREVYGVQEIFKANKSLIVTTSRYSKDAIELSNKISTEIEMRDYNDIVDWLKIYL